MGSLVDWARKVRPIIEKAAVSLDDPDAMEAAVFFPCWKPGESYKAGDRRTENGVLYRCLQEHQAQAAWSPHAAPSLWARVLLSDSGRALAWKQPDSTNPYRKGDRVIHRGKIWVSDVENNVWEPGVRGWSAAE